MSNSEPSSLDYVYKKGEVEKIAKGKFNPKVDLQKIQKIPPKEPAKTAKKPADKKTDKKIKNKSKHSLKSPKKKGSFSNTGENSDT